MMAILDEIQADIAQLAEGAGASVVGIGQRWGVGSGIVLGDGRVLTNAHNVRGDQVTVTFADGRTAEGTVAGQRRRRRPRRHRRRHRRGGRAAVGRRHIRGHRDARVRAVQPGRPRAAGDVRVRLRRRAHLPRSPGPPHHRQPRAHRAAAARLLGRPGRERRRATARDQHQPPRRGLLPGHTRRRRATRAVRRARPRRVRHAAAAGRRHRSRARGPAAAAGRRPARASTACSSAR